jgi:hypothetical protein
MGLTLEKSLMSWLSLEEEFNPHKFNLREEFNNMGLA